MPFHGLARHSMDWRAIPWIGGFCGLAATYIL